MTPTQPPEWRSPGTGEVVHKPESSGFGPGYCRACGGQIWPCDGYLRHRMEIIAIQDGDRLARATGAGDGLTATAINLFIGSVGAVLHRAAHHMDRCDHGPDEWIARAQGMWQYAQDEAARLREPGGPDREAGA